MPKVSDVIDDMTPLGAPRIDIAARIGWLLRSSRTIGGVSLREMSTALREHDVRLSSTTLGRIENEGRRSPAALDGYAAVLGMADGAMRSVVDTLCDSFSYAPPRPPEARVRSLEGFSAAVDAVEGRAPSGGDWLRFARQHASSNGFGLPTHRMEPYLRRLVDEMIRACNTAALTRYQALSELLVSPYAPMLESMMRETVTSLGTPSIDRLTSVMSDHPSPAQVRWCSELLSHESTSVAQSASWALQSMLVAGGTPATVWAEVVPAFMNAWAQDGTGSSVRRTALTQLFGSLPAALRHSIEQSCTVEPMRPSMATSWTRGGRNPTFAYVRSVARDLCSTLGHHDEPLLERLLFEASFDPRGVRMAGATSSLGGSAFAPVLAQSVLDTRGLAPDHASRAAMLRVGAFCHAGDLPTGISPLLDSAHDDEFLSAVTIHGRSGHPLPDESIRRGLAIDEASALRTVAAIGMAQDPRLASLAKGADSREVRADATWWREHGGRVLV